MRLFVDRGILGKEAVRADLVLLVVIVVVVVALGFASGVLWWSAIVCYLKYSA